MVEAGGETLTGGTFSAASITCTKPCVLDGGISTNCPVSVLVRYSGPLIPGKEHKITWTNEKNDTGLWQPVAVFKVATATSIDAGGTITSGTGTTTGSSSVTILTTGTGTTAATSFSTSAPIATDTATNTTGTSTSANTTTGMGTTTAATSSSTSTALATDIGTASATTGSSTSPAIATDTGTVITTDVDGDAGPATAKRSSSCSCSHGARNHTSLVSLLIVAFLCFARIAFRARTASARPRADRSSRTGSDHL